MSVLEQRHRRHLGNVVHGDGGIARRRERLANHPGVLDLRREYSCVFHEFAGPQVGPRYAGRLDRPRHVTPMSVVRTGQVDDVSDSGTRRHGEHILDRVWCRRQIHGLDAVECGGKGVEPTEIAVRDLDSLGQVRLLWMVGQCPDIGRTPREEMIDEHPADVPGSPGHQNRHGTTVRAGGRRVRGSRCRGCDQLVGAGADVDGCGVPGVVEGVDVALGSCTSARNR